MKYYDYDANTLKQDVKGVIIGGFPFDGDLEEAKEDLLRRNRDIVPDSLIIREIRLFRNEFGELVQNILGD